MPKRVIIAGAGIVGLAVAYKLKKKFPSLSVTVLEKEERVGAHQSSHNSGVLHAGLYYKPGSQKARMAVSGIRQMVAFCAEHGVPFDICGKLVVAACDDELPALNELFSRGSQNGLQGLRMLVPNEMLEIEPHVKGVAAIHVPEEGIVDYLSVCEVLQKQICTMGGAVRTHAKVLKIEEKKAVWIFQTTAGVFESDYFINCAGLYSDQICIMAGESPGVRIIPFRGEYYKIREERNSLVRHLIYPVPDATYPFLGVHFTRLIHGGVEAGPNAILSPSREGYSGLEWSGTDLWDSFSYGGFWRFMARHKAMCFEELKRSFSKKLFCQSLQKLVPEIAEEDLEPGGSGIRAQAMSHDGLLVNDFCFLERARALHVINAPSPAATASLAIADTILDRVEPFF